MTPPMTPEMEAACADIASRIDWTPTCLPGQERAVIVRQVLLAARMPELARELQETRAWGGQLRAEIARLRDGWEGMP